MTTEPAVVEPPASENVDGTPKAGGEVEPILHFVGGPMWPVEQTQEQQEEEDDMATLVQFTNRDKQQGPILVNPAQILTVDAVNPLDPKLGTEIRMPDNVRAYVTESLEEVQAKVTGVPAAKAEKD